MTDVDLSDMTVTVTGHLPVPPEAAWALLSDPVAMAGLSAEVQSASWLDESRFQATNRRGDREWPVVCHVVERVPPTSFRWTVLDPASPSSTWAYRLTAAEDGGTLVEHSFAHGPGPSFVRRAVQADPTCRDAVVAERSQELAAAMSASLAAAADRLRAATP